MRCPNCRDEYEPDVGVCAECGLELIPGDQPLPPRPAVADSHLGIFEPRVAEAVGELLAERDLAAETVTHGTGVEVLTERDWRDDIRTELTLTWPELLQRLPDEAAVEVRALGGQHPGWLDPPEGAWVDRQGRIVVDVADDPDDARVVGPVMAVGGGILLALAWYADLGGGLVAVGIGLVVLGLLLPR